jgi:hypothetical protein
MWAAIMSAMIVVVFSPDIETSLASRGWFRASSKPGAVVSMSNKLAVGIVCFDGGTLGVVDSYCTLPANADYVEAGYSHAMVLLVPSWS